MRETKYSLLDLQKRYRIDLDELTQWLQLLDIEIYPHADGVDRHAAVDEEELPLLDALHRHLQAGGKLAEFSGAMLPEVLPASNLSPQPGDRLQSIPRSPMLAPLPRLLSDDDRYGSNNNGDRLSLSQLREQFEFLDDCAARLWLLTTEQVCSITGLKASTLLARVKATGDCRWQSWTFTRAGRQGRESLWKVGSPRITSSVAIELAGKKSKVHSTN
ncbi:hypothetical protein [Synechococcus sp. PCC 7336]|uniref:hypothetical protein n=1 Tax=Synechococcus sp. PCC 7336 TaxID=195250 RepID=UPI0003470A83|nr:hypothetical protein [Synechococcus sp. PCC 7336]